MPFERPTLQDLIDRANADIRAELSIAAVVRRTFLSAMARVIAATGHSNHGHLKEISKQAFPDQATGLILERWSAIYGIARKQATFTTLTIDGTGTDGSVMPAGTIFQIDNGETYTTDSEITVGPAGGFASGAYTVNITAENAGSQTNLDNGETVNLQNPVSGIDSEATVTATVTEGEDTETDSALQSRIVQRIQEPPAGGKATDYIAFALSVAGVSRAWVLPGNRGLGTVDVTFLELDSGVEEIPSASKVAEVQTVVDTEKPVTADSVVFAPNEEIVNFNIELSPNTAAVRDAVQDEIKDLFSRESQVAGALKDAGTGSTYTGKIPLSKINEAVSIAAGEEDHNLISPSADVEPDPNFIARVGTFTFSTLV